MVRSSKAFGEVAMLLVCKETVSLDKFLVDSEFPWKALEVDVTLPPTVVEIITDILATVNTLHLRLKRTDRVEEEVLTGFLTALLTSAPELKSLRVIVIWCIHDAIHELILTTNCQWSCSFNKLWLISCLYSWSPCFWTKFFMTFSPMSMCKRYSRNLLRWRYAQGIR